MKKEAEERTLHRMAKVHDFVEMWPGSQNLGGTQNESCTQNMQMITVGYISDMENIVKASWSLFHHDSAAASKSSERSPVPPPLSAQNLPGGRTQILNVRRIRRINSHPVESDEDSEPESLLDTDDWLDWDGDLDHPNDSQDNFAADVESDMEQDSSIEHSECPEQRDVTDVPNVPVLILPPWILKRQAEEVLMTVSAIEKRRKRGVMKI